MSILVYWIHFCVILFNNGFQNFKNQLQINSFNNLFWQILNRKL